MEKKILRHEGGRNTLKQGSTVTQETTVAPSPVLGARRSLRQIPSAERPKEELPIRQATDQEDDLVKTFEAQPTHCREILRKRVYAYLKGRNEGGHAPNVADLRQCELSDKQHALLRDIASEVARGNENLLVRLWLVDYVEVPPTISQFIHDERFLGASCQSEDGKQGLYPEWEESLSKDFDLHS